MEDLYVMAGLFVIIIGLNLISLWIGSRLLGYCPHGHQAGVIDQAMERLLKIWIGAKREGESFQHRVHPWMLACFGPTISADTVERNHRFFEEATELVQACGMPQADAHMLVDYVYGRPLGDKPQEVGGVMVTLAALCLAQQIDMHEAGEVELARIWTKVDAIRAKQASKPKGSPLPVS